MITSHYRGHKIYYKEKQWVYIDNSEPILIERPCVRCGLMPTEKGYDACLGYIEGIISACCGHGIESPILIKTSEG